MLNIFFQGWRKILQGLPGYGPEDTVCLKSNLQKGNSNAVNTRITEDIQAISH